jgi:hypothetical protein
MKLKKERKKGRQGRSTLPFAFLTIADQSSIESQNTALSLQELLRENNLVGLQSILLIIPKS